MFVYRAIISLTQTLLLIIGILLSGFNTCFSFQIQKSKPVASTFVIYVRLHFGGSPPPPTKVDFGGGSNRPLHTAPP